MARRSKKRRAPESPGALGKDAASAPISRRTVLGALILVVIGRWIYWPALHGAFLWDDVELVTSNPDLRDVGGLGHIWFGAPSTDYWPLTWSLLWILWRICGADPFGYHLCSLALHFGNAFLIWRLLGRLGLRWGWLGALLFVIHPLAVESVAWVSEIKNTLSLSFFLLSCDAWLDAEAQKPFAYPRSVLLYLAAMLAKTSTVALPLTLMLYCWWKRGGVTRQELLRIVPYFVIALVLGLVSIHFQNDKPGDAAIPMGSSLERTIQACAAILFYLGRFVFPVDFLPIYPRPSFEPLSVIQVFTVPCVLLVLVGLWAQRRGRGRHALFGLGFFLLNLAPVLGFLKMEFMTISWVSDHLAYLAMVGLIGLLVAGVEAAQTRLPAPVQKAGLGIGLALFALLSWKSHEVASLFADDETLWAYTVQHNPRAYVAYNNLGRELLYHGRAADAMDAFQHALRVNPGYAEAHQNLGTLLLKTGRADEAADQYRLALRANPYYANAHNGLGIVLMQAGRYPEAIAEYDEALKIDPTFANAHHNMATSLLQLGRAPEAVEQEELALKYNPGFSQARDGLARAQAAVANGEH